MRAAGYRIVSESIAEARGRLYPVIAWERGVEQYPLDAIFRVGPLLFRDMPDALLQWLNRRLDRLAAARRRLEQGEQPQDPEALQFRQWVHALVQVRDELVRRGH